MQNFIAILTPTNKIAVLITANFAKLLEMYLLITLKRFRIKNKLNLLTKKQAITLNLAMLLDI